MSDVPADFSRSFSARRPQRVLVVAGRSTPTNRSLVTALGMRAGDVVLGRVDVRTALDGIEDGLWELRRVERLGIEVLNPAHSLVACHDKLQTALALERASIPHPRTLHVDWDASPPRVELPVVVKPRFGSWGRDVGLCATQGELARWVRCVRRRPWFQRHGLLVQTLGPPQGYDLRVIVADGRVVGAVERVAAPGEWRTNIALGGTRRPVTPSPEAVALALAAATAVDGDLVGVDLLPTPHGSHVVLEVNGAVDFTHEYSLGRETVFDEVARALVHADVSFADVGRGG
jgi:RimK family alpha-L-glutamate ligase